MARRQRYQRVLLPGEKEGRRDFLRKGLVGGLLLAAGGGVFLATRRTRAASGLGPLQILSPEEATVVLAVANRLVPERVGFPRPLDVGVPGKVDALLAGLHPGAQKEFRRLVNLFEGAVAGFLFEGQARQFTACSPWEQEDRLRGWAQSRVTLRRSGFRALKKLVYAAYYGSPQTWPAIGYPGPPIAPAPVAPERPPAEASEEAPPKPVRAAQQAKAAEPGPRPAEVRPRPTPPGARGAEPAEAASPPARPGPRVPEPSRQAEAPPAAGALEAPPAPRPVEPYPAQRSGVPAPAEEAKP
ncbi:MAG TPA: gluconate 2-dehydrogenase subunit 3 family protein [Anaeromyxobacteraceae bacterium]|nr:gluconate 2-dehydrogenase subunit 3 family protein [Anaeromyxobacteraceae bacterium]